MPSQHTIQWTSSFSNVQSGEKIPAKVKIEETGKGEVRSLVQKKLYFYRKNSGFFSWRENRRVTVRSVSGVFEAREKGAQESLREGRFSGGRRRGAEQRIPFYRGG